MMKKERVIKGREYDIQFVNFEVILVENALCLSSNGKNPKKHGWSQRICVKGSSKWKLHIYG